MGTKTKIEWTRGADGKPGDTWNPLIAYNVETQLRGHFCVPASPGCANCYASHMNQIGYPIGTKVAFKAQNRKLVRLEMHEPTLQKMARLTAPGFVFVCSMTDLFFEDYPDEWIDRVFDVMESNPHKIFQVLTKRAARMRDYLIARWGHMPPSHIWIGVSSENQEYSDEREAILRQTPAAIRWVSQEPQIELIRRPTLEGLDWIVVGGESGQDARSFYLEWARVTLEECRQAGVACFVKQMGSNVSTGTNMLPHLPLSLIDKKGGSPLEWPIDLRVRQFPTQEPIR